jgi:hypothetical protein
LTDIERDVLRALPEHCGRAGGAQRFSRVNGWEGSSKSVLRHAPGCPGVAASSKSPPHTAGLAVGHRGVADRLAKFASRWRSAECIVRRFSERVRDELPMPRAWKRVAEQNAKPMRSRWLAWTAFVFGSSSQFSIPSFSVVMFQISAFIIVILSAAKDLRVLLVAKST